jgi:DNA-binding transcriptional regulator YdaS (Cro superfamily)
MEAVTANRLKEKIMGTREDYQAVMETQLNQWKTQAERVQAGIAQMGAQAKAQYEKNLALLQAKQEEAWENFRKLTNAGDGAPWEQFRANMDKASGELKAAGERMTTQFKV